MNLFLLANARAICRRHQPDSAGDCIPCTRAGVNPGSTIRWPCGNYQIAMEQRRYLGDPELDKADPTP